MSFDPNRPYNDLPNLPPPGDLETRSVLKAVVPARAALAALNESLSHLPNAEIITNTIIFQEAKDSSEIENIVTTHDELFKAIALQNDLFGAGPAKEVMRYREAVRVGMEGLRTKGCLNTPVINAVNKTLLNHDAGVRATPGVTLRNTRTNEVVYTPPEGKDLLLDKLDQLWAYIHSDSAKELDILVRLALLHYQFEAIHPYSDGNGRTGRILNVLYLVQEELLILPVLYMSGAIIRTKPRYYELLRRVTTDHDWESWLLYTLEIIESTARASRDLVLEIHGLRKQMVRQIKERAPKIKIVHELTEILFTQPYSRVEFYVRAGLGTRKTVSTYLKLLADLGFISIHRFNQHTIYVNDPLFELLRSRRIG